MTVKVPTHNEDEKQRLAREELERLKTEEVERSKKVVEDRKELLITLKKEQEWEREYNERNRDSGNVGGNMAQNDEEIIHSKLRKISFKGRLHGAFSMCVSMSDKPFDARGMRHWWASLCDKRFVGCDKRFVGHEKRTV
jgi:hypothetical protein